MAPAPRHDCWSSSNSIPIGTSIERRQTAGFDAKEQCGPAHLLVVRCGSAVGGSHARFVESSSSAGIYRELSFRLVGAVG
jgi:hypothetical protein